MDVITRLTINNAKIIIDNKSNKGLNVKRFVSDLKHLNKRDLMVPDNWFPAILFNILNDDGIDAAIKNQAYYLLQLFLSDSRYQSFVFLGAEKHSSSKIGPKDSYHIRYSSCINVNNEVHSIMRLYGIQHGIIL